MYTKNYKKENEYFCCEGKECNFKSKKVKSLIYFKGKHLCRFCRNKESKCVIEFHKPNLAESTLKHYVNLPEGKNLPKEKYKDLKRVTNEMKEWAENQEGKIRLGSVGISIQESGVLKEKLRKEGIDYVQGQERINSLKNHVKTVHKDFREVAKSNNTNFKKDFTRLVNENK